MAHKCLYLLLVVNVPYSDYTVLPPTNKVLSIGGEAQWLIPVTLNGPIVFLSFEYDLLLCFKVPLYNTAVLGCSEYASVVLGPL